MPTDQNKQTGSSSSSSSSSSGGGGGGGSLPKLSGGSASAVGVAGVSLTAFLVLATLPLIHSAPVEPWQVSVDQRQPLSQASDILGEICFLMLVQKSKELKGQENNRKAELKGPAGIQSRGHYFLYRPRNGRRALEYE